jgi:hypothetical protein
MSSYLHKSHNVTVLLYHLVFPAKYRRAVIDPEVDQILRNVCLDIGRNSHRPIHLARLHDCEGAAAGELVSNPHRLPDCPSHGRR